jgi:hypothetical protein
MDPNDNFPDPPLKLSDLKAALKDFDSARARAADGSKQGMAEKKKCRQVVIKMLTQLAHYVETVSEDEMDVFLSSGFDPIGKAGCANPTLIPRILKITQGKSGELYVSYEPFYRKVIHYQLRHGPQGPGGEPPDPWTDTLTLRQARRPALITRLTPGTIYCFQVRVFKNDETYSDWSSTATRMCI